MIEKERKFLLADDSILKNGKINNIKQGYLMLERESGKQLRIRLTNNSSAHTCYKYQISATEKHEFEYLIDYADGVELYKSTDIKLEKDRCTIFTHGYLFDIDIYPDGTKIVEIEYTGDELPEEAIPYFCGEEVTGNPKYSNIRMAIEGAYESNQTA